MQSVRVRGLEVKGRGRGWGSQVTDRNAAVCSHLYPVDKCLLPCLEGGLPSQFHSSQPLGGFSVHQRLGFRIRDMRVEVVIGVGGDDNKRGQNMVSRNTVRVRRLGTSGWG